MLGRRGRFVVSLKYIILAAGIMMGCSLFYNTDSKQKAGLLIPVSIVAGACFISFALIENNDVREANKE